MGIADFTKGRAIGETGPGTAFNVEVEITDKDGTKKTVTKKVSAASANHAKGRVAMEVQNDNPGCKTAVVGVSPA